MTLIQKFVSIFSVRPSFLPTLCGRGAVVPDCNVITRVSTGTGTGTGTDGTQAFSTGTGTGSVVPPVPVLIIKDAETDNTLIRALIWGA